MIKFIITILNVLVMPSNYSILTIKLKNRLSSFLR